MLKYSLLVLLLVSSAVSARVGIGVDVVSDDTRILLPIEITKSFRIEPSVQFFHMTSVEMDYEYSYGNAEFALSFDFLKGLSSNLRGAAGIRAGYVADVYYNQFYDASNNGFVLAPHLALEYFFLQQLSIGGEMMLRYEQVDSFDLDGDYYWYSRTKSDAAISLRYYF